MRALMWIAIIATALVLGQGIARADVLTADDLAFGHQVALQKWSYEPCSGAVWVTWEPLAPHVNATTTDTTTNPADATTYANCHITFNTLAFWTREKFCTVYEHEYGHLFAHVHDESLLMGEYYRGPTLECRTARSKSLCTEDMSCWRWPTMGNHKRGILVHGKRSIVGPRAFCRLPARIRKSQHMKGDPKCIARQDIGVALTISFDGSKP